MNSFFRICVFFMLSFLVFSLAVNFINSLGAFPIEEEIGVEGTDTDDFLSILTGLTDTNMNAVWLLVTTLSGLGAIVLATFMHSPVPIGLYIFGEVFWTSYLRCSIILGTGGYIPEEFLLIFTAGAMFVFIAAIVGMLTGSG